MNCIMRFALFCLLLLALPCGNGCSGQKRPSDAEIQSLFDEHEDSFNKLAEMAGEEERLNRIEPDGSYDETAVSSERAEVYLQLLEKMGLEGAFVNWDHTGKGLLLLITPRGWASDGVFKNLRYHKAPGVHADVLGKPTKYPIYKTLGDNWQLQKLGMDSED
jgi:hypothetical protein